MCVFTENKKTYFTFEISIQEIFLFPLVKMFLGILLGLLTDIIINWHNNLIYSKT